MNKKDFPFVAVEESNAIDVGYSDVLLGLLHVDEQRQQQDNLLVNDAGTTIEEERPRSTGTTRTGDHNREEIGRPFFQPIDGENSLLSNELFMVHG